MATPPRVGLLALLCVALVLPGVLPLRGADAAAPTPRSVGPPAVATALVPGPRAPPSSWVKLSPNGGPITNITGFATAYDAADGYDVLFGGLLSLTAVETNETWIYHLGEWTQLHPNVSPPPLWQPSMAYDPQTSSVILFGGLNNFSFESNQTWSFAAGNWTLLNPGTSPAGRGGASLLFDASDNYLLLFGGSDPFGHFPYANYNDTWTFNASGKWTELTTTGTPLNCSLAASEYDPTTGKVYTFSGLTYQPGSYATDCANATWEYSAGTWSNITGPVAPGARDSSAFAFDPMLGEALLYGGQNFSPFGNTFTDVWSLKDGSWTQLASTAPPSAAPGSTFVYDPFSRFPLLVLDASSSSASVTPAVWIYDAFAIGPLTAAPANGSLEPGSTVTVAIEASVLPPGASYAWTGPPGCNPPNASTWPCKLAQPGNYTFQVNVSNAYGLVAASPALTYSVAPGLGLPTLTIAPPSIDLTQSSTLSVGVAGGAPAYAYNWSGLPPGCAGAGGAVVSCRPSVSGLFSEIRVGVTDRLGYHRSSAAASLTVFGPLTLDPLLLKPSPVDVGRPAVLSVVAQGGTGIYNYAWAGLPANCPAPPASAFTCSASSPGAYSVQVTVTDSAGIAAMASGLLSVAPLPVVSLNLSASTVDVGEPLTLTASASGGVGSFNYSFSGLPNDCATTRAPVVRCTLGSVGPLSLRATGTDSEGVSAESDVLQVTVNPLLTVGLSASASPLDRGSRLVLTAAVSGGTSPYRYAYTGLPPGCSSSDGVTLSCRPNATGTFTVRVTVTDSSGANISSTLAITVRAPAGPAAGVSPLLYLGVAVVAAAAIATVLLLRRRARRASEDWGETDDGVDAVAAEYSLGEYTSDR
ncbi:MAG TPA: hypothetical protein VGU43_02080 [Thermoplasmata archaeon]|nr:hypothetical protein [Thermoplasmata archaeon]